jgi:hypothetical protein
MFNNGQADNLHQFTSYFEHSYLKLQHYGNEFNLNY